MTKNVTQEERLDYLVEIFKRDSDDYKDLEIPKNVEEKRRVLRSLMNIRMPKEMDLAVISVQDDYLKERINENGIVKSPAVVTCIAIITSDRTSDHQIQVLD